MKRQAVSTTRPSSVQLFGGVFLFVLAMGCLVQFLVLPILLPSLHAWEGLLKGLDSAGFHLEAVRVVERMRVEGWSAWSLRPDTLNTPPGIMAAIYYLTVPHPYVLLPLNAGLWALTAVLWQRMLAGLFPTLKSWVWLPAFFVVALPSSFTWTTQFHKDIFVIPGACLILFGLVSVLTERGGSLFRAVATLILTTLAGASLVWLARPYYLQLLAAATLGTLVFAIPGWLLGRLSRRNVVLLVMSTLLLLISGVIANQNGGAQGAHLDLANPTLPPELVSASEVRGERVQPILDRTISRISAIRRGYCVDQARVGTPVDCDLKLETVSDTLAYLPRAAQLALLSPFPQTWLTPGKTPGGSQMRWVAGAETFLAYLILLAALGTLIFSRHAAPGVETWMVLLWLFIPAIIQTFANPNLGTLYRMRYPFWTGILAIALSVVLAAWLARRNSLKGA